MSRQTNSAPVSKRDQARVGEFISKMSSSLDVFAEVCLTEWLEGLFVGNIGSCRITM